MAEKENGYTPEQLQDAERLAQVLKDTPKEEHNIIVMLGNAFISGLEAGMQLPGKQRSGF